MPRRAHKEAGFTLVELMTVMVIIGLVSSAVILTIPREKPPETQLANELVRALNGAAQETLLSGQPARMNLSATGLSVDLYENGRWTEKFSTTPPRRMGVEFERDGKETELPEDPTPFVIFEPTGQATPFVLTLSGDQKTFRLVSTGNGRVSLESGL